MRPERQGDYVAGQSVVADYLQSIVRDVFGSTLERRVLLNLNVSTVSLAVTLGQAGVDMVLADDIASVKVSRRLFISTTSCLVAQVILSRQDIARVALRELAGVAAALEGGATLE
ncbi:uncharacterized protein LOC127751819 isoform X2 [Frankliniella occidentalis]|uniref:Uncharacterized protein LOC127751819 isoform X2 n=1 Tax=Frankliniella occidentalis TaxID=133901 RepID=A0A9C6X9S7_FRAOC|nr:uncharacterized protein LOC127751819 isoform X2 [Frankliniella occidentalis]